MKKTLFFAFLTLASTTTFAQVLNGRGTDPYSTNDEAETSRADAEISEADAQAEKEAYRTQADQAAQAAGDEQPSVLKARLDAIDEANAQAAATSAEHKAAAQYLIDSRAQTVSDSLAQSRVVSGFAVPSGAWWGFGAGIILIAAVGAGFQIGRKRAKA